MKILIVGLGVVGVIHGWALAEAGVEVTHQVRPGRAAGVGAGINLDVLDLRQGRSDHHRAVYRPRVSESVSPSADYDLVLVPTKQYQAAAAGHFKGNPEEMKRFFLDVYKTGLELGADMPHLEQIYATVGEL